MLPYFSAPEIRVGGVHLSTQNACMVAAILLAYAMAVRRARKLELRAIGEQYVWAVACAILAANLVPIVLPSSAVSRHGAIALGGLWGALLGAVGWMLIRRIALIEQLRRLDLFAYVAPFAWSLARLGCALAHDHPGIPSHHFLAVRFPGVPRYDLGVLEMLLAGATALVFAALGRRQRISGLYLGLSGILYGAFRLAIEPLRVEPASTLRLFDRVASGASVAVGLAVLVTVSLETGRSEPTASRT